MSCPTSHSKNTHQFLPWPWLCERRAWHQNLLAVIPALAGCWFFLLEGYKHPKVTSSNKSNRSYRQLKKKTRPKTCLWKTEAIIPESKKAWTHAEIPRLSYYHLLLPCSFYQPIEKGPSADLAAANLWAKLRAKAPDVSLGEQFNVPEPNPCYHVDVENEILQLGSYLVSPSLCMIFRTLGIKY